jgi:phosphocarrier protein FPr
MIQGSQMERSTIVRVHEGLHARPATRFVKLAKGFECNIEIAKSGKSVSAKSSVKLMLLGVKENDEVTVRAEGADAIEALEALIGYLENPRAGLEENEGAAVATVAEAAPVVVAPVANAAVTALPEGQIKGVAASEGLSLGEAFPFFPAEITPGTGKLTADEIEPEISRYEAAVATVQERMEHSLARGDLAESDRGIVAALKDIASDDSLRDEALALIRGGMDARCRLDGRPAICKPRRSLSQCACR